MWVSSDFISKVVRVFRAMIASRETLAGNVWEISGSCVVTMSRVEAQEGRRLHISYSLLLFQLSCPEFMYCREVGNLTLKWHSSLRVQEKRVT